MTKIGFSGKEWCVDNNYLVCDSKEILDLLLKKRGIVSVKDKRDFLSPPSPFELDFADFGLNKKDIYSALRILAKNFGKKIVIYGDYDADGITSAAVLWEALYSRGFDVLPYLPDRNKEGYGVKAKSVFYLKDKYPDLSLILTVDNGIVAFDDIEKIKGAGMSVIVVDHHKKEKLEPSADAIIHTTKVAAVGAAWCLAQEIKKQFPVTNSFYDNDGTDLAAIGTIADQVELLGTNRSLVKYGIDALRQTKRKGLIELFKEAGVSRDKIGTYEVNFIVAPRINAVGRISHALESLQLLCTKDRERAEKLALHLGHVNRERQKLLETSFLDARDKVLKRGLDRRVILIANESYVEGILGLVASRLVEEFYRPAIVISVDGNNAKGSCRSVLGFDITSALRTIGGDLFTSLGGHSAAAGFSIPSNRIDMLEKRIESYARNKLNKKLLRPKLSIDVRIELDIVDEELVMLLSKFEPVGMGNPVPLFLSQDLKIIDVKRIGKGGEHLKLLVSSKDRIFDAIAFNMGNFFEKIEVGTLLDLVYSLDFNNWNGNSLIQLNVKDLSESGK